MEKLKIKKIKQNDINHNQPKNNNKNKMKESEKL